MEPRDVLKNISTIILNVSGGMDSAVASTVAVSVAESLASKPKIYMVYAHTPLALEENKQYVEKLARWLGVELRVVYPRDGGGLEALTRRGWPNPFVGARWCMYHWKLYPIIDFSKTTLAPRVHVLGIRVHESIRRFNLFGSQGDIWFYCLKSPRYCGYYYAPILRWKKEDVQRAVREYGIPQNPLWGEKGHSSHDCTICIAYANASDYRVLKTRHPEIWEKLYRAYREMNEKNRRGRKILASHYVDLDSIAREKTLLDYSEPREKCRACLITQELLGG